MSFLDRDEVSAVCKGGCDSCPALFATEHAAHTEVFQFLVVNAGRAPREGNRAAVIPWCYSGVTRMGSAYRSLFPASQEETAAASGGKTRARK